MRLLDHAKNVHSQFGEDGIFAAILESIPDKDKWCVEFGAWDGERLSNTCNLIENSGYSAVLIKANRKKFAGLIKRHGSNPKVVALNQCVGFSSADGLDAILERNPHPKRLRPAFHRYRRQRLPCLGCHLGFYAEDCLHRV